MSEIKVPTLGESVTEATIAKWYKKAGEAVEVDEIIAELETDKVTLEVNAPTKGVIAELKVPQGGTVTVGEIIGVIDEKGVATVQTQAKVEQPTSAAAKIEEGTKLSPAVGKLVSENNLNPRAIAGTGKDGRLTKGDVLGHMAAPASTGAATSTNNENRIERVKMSRLRKRIAERLKESQNTAAILSTFNEIDMTNVMATRNKYKDVFEKKHGVKLGFMSFFVKAVVAVLKEIPAVNAEINGDDIIYKNFYDIGVAVGTDQGLVVPVLRDADKLSFAQIEAKIADLGKRAREGKLALDELSGGTFSITNGGVYGSLLSTPIINPPQSGILGMHRTLDRPVAVDGKVEIRPMMYVALSYDHRIIDGKEAVTFLFRVKELIENPERLLFEL